MSKGKKAAVALAGVILLGAIIAAVCIGIHVAPSVNHALRISELLQPFIHADNQAMHICVSAAINDERTDLESDIYIVTDEDAQYLVLEQNGSAVYVVDNILLLENGKAFKLGEKMQAQTLSYQDLLPHIVALYDALQITAQKTGNETLYSVTVTGGQVDALLAAASLGEVLPVGAIEKLHLQLTEKDGKLDQIRFSGSGKVNETAVEADVSICAFRIPESGDYAIPEAVRQAAATVDPNTLFSLTEDLYRLVLAMAPLADMESLDGNLQLRVDCGLIQLHTDLRLSDLPQSDSAQLDAEQLTALPEIAALMCLEGDIRCTQKGEDYVYTMSLDEAAMQQLSRMILPELAQYGNHLSEGSVTIMLYAGAISSLDIAIEGKIGTFVVQVPITVGATFSFD